MFETGLCRSDAKQCKILTGYPIENCRLYITLQTTGDAIHFFVDSKVEVNWGDDEWVTYEAGVITGYQLFPEIKTPVEVRGVDVATKLFFGNRASPDYTYIEINILLALDLEDAERMCYNLGELESFSFNKSNNVKSFKSSWEKCCKLKNFNGIDISDALTIEKAWKDCSSLQTMTGLYSDKVLTAEEAFYRCGMMSNYSDIILESCTNWRRTFGHNTNLQIMNYLDTSEGTNFGEMFHYNRQLRCIMAVDTLKQETTWNMFLGCNSLEAPNSKQQTLILNGYEWEQGRPCDDEEPCNGVYCENFNVYNTETHGYDRMVVIGAYPFMVGLNHFGCSGENPPIFQPDFGYTCEVNVDCPSCATFKVYQGFGIEFDNFIFSDGGEYHISTDHHGTCIGEANPDLLGYTCDVGIDCPDCVTYNVFNKETGSFERYSVGGASYQVGTIHGGCGEDTTPVLPNYGLTCTVDVDCPNCVTYNIFDGYGKFMIFKPIGKDIYAVGTIHGGCGIDTQPTLPNYGLQCTIGVDCPDCIDFKVLNATEDDFVLFAVNDGHYSISSESGSCATPGVVPGDSQNVTATTTDTESITVIWDAPSIGTEPITYTILRNGTAIETNAISPWSEDVAAGTYTYTVRAINAYGSSDVSVDGTSVAIVLDMPEPVTDFKASENKIDKIRFTWINSITTDPVVSYVLFEWNGADFVEMSTNVISPHTEVVPDGEKTYAIHATNINGDSPKEYDTGIALPSKLAFNVNVVGQAEYDRFIANGQLFTVAIV